MLQRLLVRFLDYMDQIGSPPDWRVRRHADGLYYTEWEHMDQGWVYDEPGYQTMIEAGAAGQKRYERRKV